MPLFGRTGFSKDSRKNKHFYGLKGQEDVVDHDPLFNILEQYGEKVKISTYLLFKIDVF